MKTKIWIYRIIGVGIIALLFVLLSVAQQFSNYANNLRQTIASWQCILLDTSGTIKIPVYYNMKDLSSIDNSYIGKNDPGRCINQQQWYTYRMCYKWDISSIPSTATIKGAILEIWYTAAAQYSQDVAFSVTPFSLQKWVSDATTVWAACSTGTAYSTHTIPLSSSTKYLSVNYAGSQTICRDIATNLSSHAFAVAMLTTDDQIWNTTNGNRYLQPKQNSNTVQGVKLTINYTIPIAVTVQNGTPGNGDTVIVDGSSYISPHSFNWTSGDPHILLAKIIKIGGTIYSPTGWTDKTSGQVWNENPHIANPIQSTTYEVNFVVSSVTVKVDQKLSTNLTVDSIGHWEGGPDFVRYKAPQSFTFSTLSTQTLRAIQDTLSGEKYNNWDLNTVIQSDVTNHHSFPILASTSTLTSHFKPTTQGSEIKVDFLEVPGNYNGLTIQFKDPWLIDSTDGIRNNKPLNRGMNALLKSRTTPFSPSIGTLYNGDIYKGVFLGQGGPDPNHLVPPYYSVGAPLTQLFTVNAQSYPSCFVNWTTTNAVVAQPTSAISPLVFNTANATVTAQYKGIHLSNNSSTFSNNSQRKFIRTQNSQYHMVYESMGHVWYEYSSDNGAHWTLAGGQPLDNGNGKLPSIDYNGTSVVIVFQQKTGNCYTVQLQQWIFQNGNYILNWSYPLWTEPVDLYSTNANPNIAWGIDHSFVVTLERKNNYYSLQGGINYVYGTLYESGDHGCMNTGFISGTDANSVNVTIYTNKSTLGSPPFFDIAYEQDASSTSSSIKYCALYEWYYATPPCFGIVQDPQSPLTISIPGIPRSYHPSIVQFPDGNVRVYYIHDHSGVGDEYSVHSILCDPWATPIQNWEYALNVKSASINMIDNSNNFYFVWSQYWANAWNNKFVSGSNLSQIKTLNTTGQDVQLCNGSASTNMLVSVYRPVTLPYNFQTSNSLGSFGKVNSISISSGRGVAIGKDGAGFFYSLGDITVDGNTINFVHMKDRPAYDSLNNLHNNNVIERKDRKNNNSINDVNKVLVSDPFEVKENSEVIFNEQSGVGDSLAAAKLLGENGYVSFKIELVDDASGKVIGSAKELKLSSTNLPAYKLSSYSLKTKGIRSKMLKVRITMATTIYKPEFSLIDQYADLSEMGKKAAPKELTLEGVELIVDYALSQNYPNPFNPSTSISYQIPNKGHVTLKVYDVLGRGVATLVDEMKEAGYYTATFDARNHASGIYFARFTVTDELKKNIYAKSLKLLLMK